MLIIALEFTFKPGGDVAAQSFNLLLVIVLAIDRPVIHLLPDVIAECVDVERMPLVDATSGARAQVRRNINLDPLRGFFPSKDAVNQGDRENPDKDSQCQNVSIPSVESLF